MQYSAFYFCLVLLVSCQSPQPSPTSRLDFVSTPESVTLTRGDQPVLTYWLTPQLPEDTPEHYRRSGFIHPVYSPGGTVITDDFPVDHSHQHGIFSAWVQTDFRGEFHDFWNQQKETGTARHVRLLDTVRTDSSLILTTLLEQVSLKHGPVLEETWTIEVFNGTGPFVWELRSRQINVTADTLFIRDYHYGGLGVRGNRVWNRADSTAFTNDAQFATSEGLSRDSANHSRPEWTAMYGAVGQDTAGLAVIPAATNYRHPVPVRVHPEMPYFAVAPMVGQAFYIAPGERYDAAYRFVVFDGDLPRQRLNLEAGRYVDK